MLIGTVGWGEEPYTEYADLTMDWIYLSCIEQTDREGRQSRVGSVGVKRYIRASKAQRIIVPSMIWSRVQACMFRKRRWKGFAGSSDLARSIERPISLR